MITGRKYVGKVAMFGERVLARLPTTNGEDRFRPGIWLGKTDRADFNIVATVDGLRWTRTIRRLPIAYDAETIANVRTWPWNAAYGQIGTKSTPLLAKVPGVLQFELKRGEKLLNVVNNHLRYLHLINKKEIKEELQGRQGLVMRRLQTLHHWHLRLHLQVARHLWQRMTKPLRSCWPRSTRTRNTQKEWRPL
jgi:hypothetical protein